MSKSINQEKCKKCEKWVVHNEQFISGLCACPCHREKGQTGTPNAINIDHFPEYKPFTSASVPKCKGCKNGTREGCYNECDVQPKEWDTDDVVCGNPSCCPTPKNESWEEEFDYHFTPAMFEDTGLEVDIKSFIRSQIAEAEERGRQSMLNVTILDWIKKVEQDLLASKRKKIEGLFNEQVAKVGLKNIKGVFDSLAYNRAINDVIKIIDEK